MAEADLLATILPLLPTGQATRLGPGDDSAVVSCPDGRVTVSSDILVEGVHFRSQWSNGFDIGWRLAAQNLSDAAAMGARPTSLVVALAGRAEQLSSDWLEAFANGLAACCSPWGVGVVGGDLSAGPILVACATVLGDLAGRPPVTRSGARPGDVLALAGGSGLGWSAGGLAVLEASGPAGDLAKSAAGETALAAYLRPDPPIDQGERAALGGASAMLDVSDGLMIDSGRLAAASGVRLVIDAASGGLAAAAKALAPLAGQLGCDPWDWVAGGGEDHALLATFPAGRTLPDGWDGIGQVESPGPVGPGAQLTGLEADRIRRLNRGWDHF
ncbi:MAG: thiamine-phosphate kinase [Bifidobacteriaceae bacterium]|jgi:thiamine-monophosphate kinase|nr:thiamine-phosphate kinase [Bifidobacteriaceae bacterium]